MGNLQVKCPLKGCGAIFPRETTAAGVSVEGLGERVDDMLRNHVVGADLNEVEPETHALLPLPGLPSLSPSFVTFLLLHFPIHHMSHQLDFFHDHISDRWKASGRAPTT